MSAPSAGPARRLACGFALFSCLVAAGRGLAAGSLPTADEPVPSPAVSRELFRVRPLAQCDAVPTDDVSRELAHLGRAAIEVTGRAWGAIGASVRDTAIFDTASGRIVSYVCHANASTRRAGEAIVSLAEISSRADARARLLLPDVDLALESVERYRVEGEESVYYEARYQPLARNPPFLEPPARLLLNASTGALFRLDFDPDWLDPAPLPRLMISRKVAERIAAVVLDGRDLTPAFGAGAVLGQVGPAELFMVRPNPTPGPGAEGTETRLQPAWVVPYRVSGGDAAGTHSLFVGAATGRLLGESAAAAPASLPR